ncbi:MAG: hypothetical protein KME19_23115 [Microcoleus vaginatus WJT46-NPBG5]|nr:hypothetical protein [Microcoleus vaginatus WJT46-NPBG5]
MKSLDINNVLSSYIYPLAPSRSLKILPSDPPLAQSRSIKVFEVLQPFVGRWIDPTIN